MVSGGLRRLARICSCINAVKELLPIIVEAAVWGEQWLGLVVLCRDNQAVVAAVKGGYCRDPGYYVDIWKQSLT